MANIDNNNPPILNDTDYVDKIKNSLDAIDDHDHTTGKGVQIPTGGIANGAVTNAKITGPISIANGGTGQATANAGFNALSPMTTEGDIIYGAASGAATRLAKGTNGQVLSLVAGIPAWQNAGSAGTPTIQKFTSGSGTYTTPSSPAPSYIRVRMVGGGGGGAGGGTGSPTSGGSGGNTTFGTALLVANGGTGGANNGNAVAGGSASLGAAVGTAIAGSYGSASGQQTGTSTYVSGGAGGVSPFGGAGSPGNNGFAATAALANSGAGGGGGGMNNAAGSSGAGGGSGGYVDAIITSPSATYAYAVGAAGTAGSAGTNGTAGGAGGSGYIIVEEFYN